MPFIGNQPALSYTSFAKQDFTTSATTAYTLSQPVANANEIALFINFVRQEPTTAYTASGTSLTLTSATSASDDMYAIFLGKAVQTVNPPAGSVGLSQLSATGTKDSTTFLRGDNTFAQAGLNGWSENGANNNLLPASASAGIYLGVNSATASNLLDDYEEGTWTGGFTGTTGAPSGVSYDNRIGKYTKIGNFVSASIYLSLLSWSSGPSGDLRINGLPFVSSSGTYDYQVASIGFNYGFSSNNAPQGGYLGPNSSSIIPLKRDSNEPNGNLGTVINAATLSGNEQVILTINYLTP